MVDDLFMTETAKYADVILPRRSYAEKGGHVHEHRAARPARAQSRGRA